MNSNLWKKINVQPKQQLIKNILTYQNAKKAMYQIQSCNYSKTNFQNNVQVIDHDEHDDHDFNKFIKQLQNQGIVIEIQSPKSQNQNNQIQHHNQNENDFQTKQYFGQQFEQTIVQKLLTNSMNNFAIGQNYSQSRIIFNSLELKKMDILQKVKGELYYLKRLLFAIIQLINQSRIEMQMYRKHIPINFNELVQQYHQIQLTKTIILKQKITSLQRIIKQKDIQINQLTKQKSLLQFQNQKLNEDIFDMNQKVAQIDLKIQQSVKQILKKKLNQDKKLNISKKSQKSKFSMKPEIDYVIEDSKNIFQQRLQLQINSNKPIGSLMSQNDFPPSRPFLLKQMNIIPPQLKYFENFENSQLNLLDSIYPKHINSRQLTPVPSIQSKLGLSLNYRSQSQSSILKNISPKNNNGGSPKLSQSYSGTLKNKSKPKFQFEKYEKPMIVQRKLSKSKNVDKINTLGTRIEQLRNQIRKQIKSFQ